MTVGKIAYPDTRVPPYWRDYSAWSSETGIPVVMDPVWKKEHLESSIQKFKLAIESLPLALQSLEYDIQKNLDEAFSGGSREFNELVLRSVEWDGASAVLDSALQDATNDVHKAKIMRRYYDIACYFADLWQTKACLERKAADADLLTYRVLDRRSRMYPELSEVIGGCLADFKWNRCDSSKSNFCLAHKESERRFKACYEKMASENPDVLKPISSWYRYHLHWAKNILGRNPSWADE